MDWCLLFYLCGIRLFSSRLPPPSTLCPHDLIYLLQNQMISSPFVEIVDVSSHQDMQE